jgi:hypothetical protein
MWFGILLIAVGTLMLLDRLNVLTMSVGLVFWAGIVMVSGVMLVRNMQRKDGGIFWWTVLLFIGLYKTMALLGIVEIEPSLRLPLILVIGGCATVVMVISQPHRWHLLVPGIVMLGLGGALILTEFGYVSAWDLSVVVRNYWPVVLVLFGAALLLNRPEKKSEVMG